MGGEDIKEMMRDAGPLSGGSFRGADVEAAVDLKGIAIDDFAMTVAGEGESEVAFAGGCGSADDEKGMKSAGGHNLSVNGGRARNRRNPRRGSMHRI
jgi:hypothetical protein